MPQASLFRNKSLCSLGALQNQWCESEQPLQPLWRRFAQSYREMGEMSAAVGLTGRVTSFIAERKA